MKKAVLLYTVLFFLGSCRQSYDPPQVNANKNFLVVNGFINSTPNGITTIYLSRSKNISDSLPAPAENGAQVSVESNVGQSYLLIPQTNGGYAAAIPIQPSILYRLRILTQNGTQYLSDYVAARITPPVDSLTWDQPNDALVFVSTHDPANNSKYYRYDYTETWEYHAAFETIWGVDSNKILFARDTSNQIFRCWSTDNSTDIATATSIKLNQDIINHFQVARIPQNSSKIAVRYSILVNQYSITKDAYDFWQILQKNTQQVGTLFDPQPSQIKSNIHNINNLQEPVLGYLSVTSVEQKRLFINHYQLTNWAINSPSTPGCQKDSILINFPHYTYPNPYFVPYYFVSGGPLYVIPAPCVDCTIHGGTNKEPSYW